MVRADGFGRLPMVRMTNVGLLPGDSSLEEIIQATDDGIYMETNRSWSIDDLRLNFQLQHFHATLPNLHHLFLTNSFLI